MLTLPEAQAAILTRVRAAERTETVPLARACGRFAARTLHAVVDNPAFDNSAMDGYAARAAELPGTLPIAGVVAAGEPRTGSVQIGRAHV